MNTDERQEYLSVAKILYAGSLIIAMSWSSYILLFLLPVQETALVPDAAVALESLLTVPPAPV